VAVPVVVEFAATDAGVWRAITCQVFGAGWNRGASEDRGVIAVPEAGEASIYLYDPQRDLDPANPGGAYTGQIDVGVPIRVSLAGQVAFIGRVQEIRHDLEPADDPSLAPRPVCRISAVDGAAKMAAVDTPTTFPQETAGARVTRLLDLAGVATGSGQRDIEAGGVVLQAGALVNSAWSDSLAAVQNELGSVDFRPDGKVVFRTRTSTWTPGAPALQLGCQVGGIPLGGIQLVTVRDTIRNQVNAARAGGTAVTETDTDPARLAKYGLRTVSRMDLRLLTDPDVDAWAKFLLARTKLPSRGYEQAVVYADAAAVAAVEAVPLFTGRVHLVVDGFGATLDTVVRLLGVSWDVDADGNATASLVLGTDTGVQPVSYQAMLDLQAQWVAYLGAASGGPAWAPWVVEGDTLRAASGAAGGMDAVSIAWQASG
jgi:hypothetical protein